MPHASYLHCAYCGQRRPEGLTVPFHSQRLCRMCHAQTWFVRVAPYFCSGCGRFVGSGGACRDERCHTLLEQCNR